MIPLSVPVINGNEWKYIKECLDTGWVSSSGSYVNKFEEAVANYTGVNYAIAVASGTAALHLCLIESGVGANDEVIVPDLTFIAPINAIAYLGAKPLFMDCDEYYNIDVDKTIEFIENNTSFIDGKTTNNLSKNHIKAIIPVHIFGNAVQLDKLVDYCKKRNITIIEDATESLGTKYIDGKYTGKHTGTLGIAGCLSFNGNKIITTGGGGMILTNNNAFAQKVKYLSTQAKDDEIKYIHNNIGFNYRMTNIQAAMGLAQIEQLDTFIKIKTDNYLSFQERLENIEGIKLASTPNYCSSNHWLNAIRIDETVLGINRDEVMNYLDENGIQSRPLWYPNHLQLPYQNEYKYKLEKSILEHSRTLNIPSSSNLKENEIQYISEILTKLSKHSS